MQPLEIRFRLVTPMRAPEAPFHLDALIAWSLVEQSDGDLAVLDELPFERFVGPGGPWVWKASRIIPHVVHRDLVPMTRTFDVATLADHQGTVYIGGPNRVAPGTGPYKAYQLAVPMLQAPEALAWCIGDREQLARLLRSVTNLGKLSRLDAGRIGSVEIIEDPHPELSRWKLRTMPAKVEGYRRASMTLRPPYWNRRARVDAWEPPAHEIIRAARWHNPHAEMLETAAAS